MMFSSILYTSFHFYKSIKFYIGVRLDHEGMRYRKNPSKKNSKKSGKTV